MDNNAYLLRCRATGGTVLVDAAAEPERLLALIDEHAAGRLDRVVTTHRHQDHWGALSAVVAATGARTAAGRPDAPGIPVPTDDLLEDGDTVRVGEEGSGAARLRVVALVGHTPGSVALVLEESEPEPHVLTGDSLFPGGVGRTGSPADFISLLDDVERELFGTLPDAAVVHPGHGRDTTLGAERPALGAWRARGW
nr:MBL fold metallo-hydrolase [Motilibacter aurantiacus]